MRFLLYISWFFCTLSFCCNIELNKISSFADKKDCLRDTTFINKYTNCLTTITMARHGLPVAFNNRLKAVECLEAVTNIESSIIKHSDTPYLLYQVKENDTGEDTFGEDLKKWINWLNKHYCEYTMEKAELSLKERSKKLGMDLIWPDTFYENVEE